MVTWFRRRVWLTALAPLLIMLAACAGQPCTTGSAAAATAPIPAAAPVAAAPAAPAPAPASGGAAEADSSDFSSGSDAGPPAEPGESAGFAPLPVALPPAPKGSPQTVVYEVFATDPSYASPVYVDSDGKMYYQSVKDTPWSRAIKMSDLVKSYLLQVDNTSGKGFTVCRISVNGVVKAQKYIDGPHSVKGVNNGADCRWPSSLPVTAKYRAPNLFTTFQRMGSNQYVGRD